MKKRVVTLSTYSTSTTTRTISAKMLNDRQFVHTFSLDAVLKRSSTDLALNAAHK